MFQYSLNGKIPVWWRKASPLFLACTWSMGMLVGTLAADSARTLLCTVIRNAVQLPATIPGLLTTTVLPFLFSAFAFSFYEPLLLVICVGKAFAFSYCAYGVFITFGSAGWLVRCLFLFSDCIIIPILLFYWIRLFSCVSTNPRRELLSCLGISMLIGGIDYYLVSPFLVTLIST